MTHFFIRSKRFFALCRQNENFSRFKHIIIMELRENKIIFFFYQQQQFGSLTFQKLLCILIQFFFHFFFKLSLNTHFAIAEGQRRQPTAQSEKKNGFSLYDLWQHFAMVYSHWYQTNSRWQPSKSLSAIKRNANSQPKLCEKKKREENRFNSLGFLAVSNYLWSLDLICFYCSLSFSRSLSVCLDLLN